MRENAPPPRTARCSADTQPNKRLLHLDLLRLIAIYLVIFNHTGQHGFMLFAESVESPLYILYMLVSVFCKVAVPLFFMISGALLLPRQESLGKLFSRRILRMLAVLVLISVPYYVWLHRTQGLSVGSFLTYIYGNSATTSLWYLYSYVALLLMMPFLRSMVKSMQEQDFLYLFAGYLLFSGVVPCLEYCLWKGEVTTHESFTPVLFLMPNMFYALMGYYLEHIADCGTKRKRRIALGILLSIAALLATCFLTHTQMVAAGQRDTHQLERFFNCFICIPALTLYDLLKWAAEKIRGARAQKLLPFLGGTVFGIYLIEKFCRALTSPIFHLTAPFVGSLPASLLWVFAALCLSFVIVAILKNTPGIRKLVNRFI